MCAFFTESLGGSECLSALRRLLGEDCNVYGTLAATRTADVSTRASLLAFCAWCVRNVSKQEDPLNSDEKSLDKLVQLAAAVLIPHASPASQSSTRRASQSLSSVDFLHSCTALLRRVVSSDTGEEG